MTDTNTRFVRVHQGDHEIQAHIEERGEGKERVSHLVVQDLRGGAAVWHHPEHDEAEIDRLRRAHPEIKGLFEPEPEAQPAEREETGQRAPWLR